MAAAGESSSKTPPIPTDVKPVVVRVKRKASHSLLHGFWLEIPERPTKRSILDFEKLSISESTKKEELKTKMIFVKHVETVCTTKNTRHKIQSFLETDSADSIESKTKGEERRHAFNKENETDSADSIESKTKSEERRHTFKKENRHNKILSKSIRQQEVAAKNARFEQIWRSRKGDKEKLREMCNFYEFVRVDVVERSNEVQQQEEDLEEQRIMSSYLPLLREFIPSAAEEFETQAYKFKQDDFVYDYYTVKTEAEMGDSDADTLPPFPLVQADDYDIFDELEESLYESDDSNAENHPWNDYPDEISEEEEEDGESEASESESEENESDKSSEHDVREDHGLSYRSEMSYFRQKRSEMINVDDCDHDDYGGDYFDYYDDDTGDGEVEEWR